MFAGLYFRLFAAPDKFTGLNFRLIFASSKPSFEYFDYSPGSNFRLLEPWAKMAKKKSGKISTFIVYKSSHYSDHRHKNIIICK